MKVGYARVSTPDQNLERQIDDLLAAGCEKVYREIASGKRGALRPEWDRCLEHLRAGDTLVVAELSRLGRNAAGLGAVREELEEQGVALSILNLGLDTSTPAGKLIFTVIGAVSEMERDLLLERTMSGLRAARARGRVGGRKPSLTPNMQRDARRLYNEGRLTVAEIAAKLGVSRQTIYRTVK